MGFLSAFLAVSNSELRSGVLVVGWYQLLIPFRGPARAQACFTRGARLALRFGAPLLLFPSHPDVFPHCLSTGAQVNPKYFKEVYSSKYGLVRIFKVLNISKESKVVLTPPRQYLPTGPAQTGMLSNHAARARCALHMALAVCKLQTLHTTTLHSGGER